MARKQSNLAVAADVPSVEQLLELAEQVNDPPVSHLGGSSRSCARQSRCRPVPCTSTTI